MYALRYAVIFKLTHNLSRSPLLAFASETYKDFMSNGRYYPWFFNHFVLKADNDVRLGCLWVSAGALGILSKMLDFAAWLLDSFALSRTIL